MANSVARGRGPLCAVLVDVVAHAQDTSVCHTTADGTIDCVKEEREDDIVVSQSSVASIARWVSESLRILQYVHMHAGDK